jgi:hypothetical protein
MARPAVPDEQPEYGTKPANLPGSISTGQHIELSMERPEPTIGRDPDNAIRLDDPKRCHAGTPYCCGPARNGSSTTPTPQRDVHQRVADHCNHHPPRRRRNGPRQRLLHVPPEGRHTLHRVRTVRRRLQSAQESAEVRGIKLKARPR